MQAEQTQTARTPYLQRIIDRLDQRIAEWQRDVIVRTNSGTYGDGDPQRDDYIVYEQLDGSRYARGCDPTEAPGRDRQINHIPAKRRRELIAEAEQLQGRLINWPSHQPLPRHDISRLTGWTV